MAVLRAADTAQRASQLLDMLTGGQPQSQQDDAPAIDREANTHSGNGRLNYDAHQNETSGVYHLDREDRNPAAAAV